MQSTNRRAFIAQSLAVAGSALLTSSTPLKHAAAEAQSSIQSDLISGMKWLNEPASWKISQDRVLVH